MVLPSKHMPLNRSLVGLGGEILASLKERPRSISAAWDWVRERNNSTSFEQFALAASFLYTMGAIELEGDVLRRVGGPA